MAAHSEMYYPQRSEILQSVSTLIVMCSFPVSSQKTRGYPVKNRAIFWYGYVYVDDLKSKSAYGFQVKT